jgi:hypothetical protein
LLSVKSIKPEKEETTEVVNDMHYPGEYDAPPLLNEVHPNNTSIKKNDLKKVNVPAAEEGIVENSTKQIVEGNAEVDEDVNEIRRKIKESLNEKKKPGISNPQDFRKGKNSYQKDLNLKVNNPEKNAESKRYRQVENESFVQEIAEALDDDHSLGAFRVIVDRIPKHQIRIFLSIIKDTFLTGRIKKSRGAMFISLAKDYARENKINLNFK